MKARLVRDWTATDRQALRRVKDRAKSALPAAWLPAIEREARSAPRPLYARFLGRFAPAESEVWRRWLDEFGGAAASDLSDAEIKDRAEVIAASARRWRVGELTRERGPWHEFVRVLEFCAAHEVDPPPVALLLSGMGKRVRCPLWWRRALRRMVARKCERGALALGLVSKPAGQPYASDKAVWRRIGQNRRNAEALSGIVMENDEGYRRTLAELAATSTSNKAIRRGELMTRIRGCEVIADECGNPGIFLTLTCPSRFHSTLRTGQRNPRHDGSTPRDAQQWLCATWARARAALARAACAGYGFRVAEPHHDGCTHWHMLLWFASEAALVEACAIIRRYWLKDAGDEPGAQEFRINVKRMERGGAAGYVAKYVAKNIDDAHIADHLDDYADERIGPDLLGDVEIKPSMRVEAWAATWGIRQFQPLGQPPVMVWRELRRIGETDARRAGFNGLIHRAWLAAQKAFGVLADWARYVKAQGGMLLGRGCAIVMRHDLQDIEGRYGRAVRPVPVGVSLNLKCARIVWSQRRLWRAVRSAGAPVPALGPASRGASAAPRTRVNNCTVGTSGDADREAERLDFLRGQGGFNGDSPPCDASNWPSGSAKPPTRAPQPLQ